MDAAETNDLFGAKPSGRVGEDHGEIYGILGMMLLKGEEHLAVITQIAEVAHVFEGSERKSIYQIKDVQFFPIIHPLCFANATGLHNGKPKQNTAGLITKLQKYLRDGFYFGRDYDITASRQSRLQFKKKIEGGVQVQPIDFIACEPRYFWNRDIYQGFQENNVSVKWCTPIIQGHVGYVKEPLESVDIEIVMITRRQKHRAGTRLNARGLDDEGFVANFAETEQIVKIKDLQYSFVIIRGSVPVFWSQEGKGGTKLYEDVILTRSSEMTKEAFRKHFSDVTSNYGTVHIIDLLKDATKREERLTKEYYKLFYDSEFRDKGSVKFLHFDFHRFTKGDKFQPLRVLISQIDE